MIILVNIFGALLVLAGVTLIIKPNVIIGFISNNSEKIWLYITAIVVRIVLGSLLVYVASFSQYPLAITILGWLTIIAGVALALIGWNRFKRLLTWLTSKTKSFGRAGGVLGVCLGAFLIVAFY